MPDDSNPSLSADTTVTGNPDTIVKEYLLKHVAVFRELMEFKRKVSLCETKFSQAVKQGAKCLNRDGRIRKEMSISKSNASGLTMRITPANAYFIT